MVQVPYVSDAWKGQGNGRDRYMKYKHILTCFCEVITADLIDFIKVVEASFNLYRAAVMWESVPETIILLLLFD